ncbi:MAG: hypothetical protein EKK61_01670 [Rickettsiales bacterium]|nr:MAG: hypothetical protein EKK61_01670 [Rickettsiales bacterium]
MFKKTIQNNKLNQLTEKIKKSQPTEAEKLIKGMNVEELFTESAKEELIQLYEAIRAGGNFARNKRNPRDY